MLTRHDDAPLTIAPGGLLELLVATPTASGAEVARGEACASPAPDR